MSLMAKLHYSHYTILKSLESIGLMNYIFSWIEYVRVRYIIYTKRVMITIRIITLCIYYFKRYNMSILYIDVLHSLLRIYACVRGIS